MPLVKKPMRYAHPEGHTDVCYYTGEEWANICKSIVNHFFILLPEYFYNVYLRLRGGLITCGSDGDVRSWLNLMDDDPTASCIAEQAITVISKVMKFYNFYFS